MTNKDYPLVSVIVPAWNEEKYLKILLPRLISQDYPNFEIIVIDNNSKDKTAEVARSFGVKVVSEKRQGIIPTRTKGFRESKGEIIVRTDADTLPDKNWVSRCYQEFERFPEAVAITGTSQFYDGGLILKLVSKIIFLFFIYLGRIVMGHFPLNGPNFAVRKSVALKTSPHMDDSVVHEDMDLACHMSVYGKVRFDPTLLINTSSRRVFNNPQFIIDYSIRTVKSYLLHHPSHRLHNIK